MDFSGDMLVPRRVIGATNNKQEKITQHEHLSRDTMTHDNIKGANATIRTKRIGEFPPNKNLQNGNECLKSKFVRPY